MAEGEGEYYLNVSRIPWNPTDYPLDGSDYVFGMLLEIPEMYYITPDESVAYVYVWDKGMVKITHDFSPLTTTEREMLICQIRHDLK